MKIYFYLTVLLLIQFYSVSCGYKSPPKPLTFVENKGNLSSKEIPTAIYQGNDLIIYLNDDQLNWDSLSLYRHYLPSDCVENCQFSQSLLATIYINKIEDKNIPSNYWHDIRYENSPNKKIILTNVDFDNFLHLSVRFNFKELSFIDKIVYINPKPIFNLVKFDIIKLVNPNLVYLEWKNDFEIPTNLIINDVSNQVNIVFFRSDDLYPILTTNANLNKIFIPITYQQDINIEYYAIYEDSFGNVSDKTIFYSTNDKK